eukprot:Rhum_TRINITY_DN9835_c0_g1::Rhum_TRINITY_DN9835_c0_g1_i1::g.35251::m.35251
MLRPHTADAVISSTCVRRNAHPWTGVRGSHSAGIPAVGGGHRHGHGHRRVPSAVVGAWVAPGSGGLQLLASLGLLPPPLLRRRPPVLLRGRPGGGPRVAALQPVLHLLEYLTAVVRVQPLQRLARHRQQLLRRLRLRRQRRLGRGGNGDWVPCLYAVGRRGLGAVGVVEALRRVWRGCGWRGCAQLHVEVLRRPAGDRGAQQQSLQLLRRLLRLRLLVAQLLRLRLLLPVHLRQLRLLLARLPHLLPLEVADLLLQRTLVVQLLLDEQVAFDGLGALLVQQRLQEGGVGARLLRLRLLRVSCLRLLRRLLRR